MDNTVIRHSYKRPCKGKSQVKIIDDYTAIDIETTGLDPSCDRIIELAASKVRHGQTIEVFQELVNPEIYIDDFISNLTGITNEMTNDSKTIDILLPSFLEFVGNDTIIGHNVNFDINFIYDKCIDNEIDGISNNFIDTMRMSRKLFPDLPNHKLSTLVDAFNLYAENEHRALSDCLSCESCYEYMKQHALINNLDISELFYGYSCVHAKDISIKSTSFDTTNILYKKTCVFTGVLERMTRREAMQAVVDLGGLVGDAITKKTNFLILGNNDYCKTIKDGKSTKQKKAEKYKLNGMDIEIISENVFYDLIHEL